MEQDEIRRLSKRFKKIDMDRSGTLSIDELTSLPELENNPLVRRVASVFDKDGNGLIDFGGDHLDLLTKQKISDLIILF